MDSLPPWSVVEELLRTVVLPAAGVTVLLLVVVCLQTKNHAVRLAGSAAAVAAGLVAGNESRGLLEWWPPEGWAFLSGGPGWPVLLPVMIAALCGGLLAAVASARCQWTAGLAIRLVTVAGCAWCLTEALPPVSLRGSFALLSAGMILNWEALLAAGRRGLGCAALLALILPWGAAAATVLIFAHSARFFDLAVLLTAVLSGAGFVAALWKLDLAALFAAPAVFLPGLMLAGAANTYSEVPLPAFALIALAPCLLWILVLPPLRRCSGRGLAIAAAVAILVPCSTAVIMAARAENLEFDE